MISGFARTHKMWLQMKAQTSGFARIHKVWLQMMAQTNIKPSSAAVYSSYDFYKRLMRSRVLSINGPIHGVLGVYGITTQRFVL